ncbi:MAG: ZIP family metal transporter [Vicinamibacteraceae bacterium]|nr:ZIP family metal transporter [Vicinamibacteraceae bacterium]
MILGYILVFALLGSVASLVFAGLVLLLPDRVHRVVLPCLISYAIGTLLAAALLGLVPHALGHAPARGVMATLLGGVLVFFVLEGLLLLRHCHEVDCPKHGTAGPLILVGDALHNLVDGVVITAAFLASIPLGITTSLAIIAHEIPQETGDFAILLHGGYTRGQAFAYNLLSSLSTLVGALGAFWLRGPIESALPYVMALAAASFLYIAMADLIPMVHGNRPRNGLARQVALVLAGVATIVLLHGGR